MKFLFKKKMPGLMAACKASGFEVEEWGDEPAFDVFAKVKFDVLVIDVNQIDRATVKCLKQYSGKIRVFQLGTCEDNGMWDTLLDLGMFLGYSTPPAADIVTYRPGEFKPEFECDNAYVGDYSPKCAALLDFAKANPDASLKIFGDGWDAPQCLGRIETKDIPDLYYTAKFSGCFPGEEDRLRDIVVCGGRTNAGPSLVEIIESETWFDNLVTILGHLGEDAIHQVWVAKEKAVEKWYDYL